MVGMMGCTSSKKTQMSKSEKAMKAALLIQRWYRRYMARLEVRRRTTWNIFQSIEYAGEQDQMKLYNFFNSMMCQFSADNENQGRIIKAFSEEQQRSLSRGTMMSDELENEDKMLLEETDPEDITVEASYKGPHLTFPITRSQVQNLVQAFKSKQLLHVKYLLQLLHEARLQLRQCGNINRATTALSHQITICGDLHGKLEDLYMIFHKNGLPSVDNPYVFNGDFVDRGAHSVEVAALLFACFLSSPNEVYLNRGNHEDHLMNIRYGFIREIMKKYKDKATKVVRLFEDVFSWLPVATVVNERVLVLHGGVSEHVDLNFLQNIDRHKFASVLRPPGASKLSNIDIHQLDDTELQEWKQMLDILWSDPKNIKGSIPNTFRGGGCYFGPDVTKKVLDAHNLQLLIRSHECKPEGFEYTHDGRVLTVFSASNYYEEGSNRGAYVKFHDDDPEPHIVQYVSASSSRRKVTFTQRISKLEASALHSLRDKLLANQSKLLEEFKKSDPEGTGFISPMDWSSAMEATMDVDVPWVMMRSRLVHTNPQGDVDYNSTFQDPAHNSRAIQENSQLSVTEMLYRHKDILETIFRIFDKDNSGFISMPEFTEACGILSKHSGIHMSPAHITDIAHSLDLNNDGQIDFNEFLEAFRIVDMGSKGDWSPEKLDEVEEGEEEVLEIEDLEINDGLAKDFTNSQNHRVVQKAV
ncbi:serine/threonine-protein phosphatase with EF-hands 1-like [Littorina saxatilis]|uniref:serine/threonine-protein phosphatase with EF-hands 1-like n=1 Tax=Littorina saxatilis TaxID=31220 RepID=UPI0038B45758